MVLDNNVLAPAATVLITRKKSFTLSFGNKLKRDKYVHPTDQWQQKAIVKRFLQYNFWLHK